MRTSFIILLTVSYLLNFVLAGDGNNDSCKKFQTKFVNNNFKYIRDGLYKDNEGNIYFRFLIYELDTNKPEAERYSNLYKNYCGWLDEDYSGITKELNEIVDVDTWIKISSNYYKDSKHVYYVSNTVTSRIYLKIVENLTSDQLKFFFKGDWKHYENIPIGVELKNNTIRSFVSDQKNIYYNGEILEGTDYETFKVISLTITNKIQGAQLYAIDKNNIYRGDKKMTDKEYLREAKKLFKSDEKSHQEYAQAMYDLWDNVRGKEARQKIGVPQN